MKHLTGSKGRKYDKNPHHQSIKETKDRLRDEENDSALQGCFRLYLCLHGDRRTYRDLVTYSLISETLTAHNKLLNFALLWLHFQQLDREWIKLSPLREQLSFFYLSVPNECVASMSLVALFEHAVSVGAGWEGKITIIDWRWWGWWWCWAGL